MLPTLGQLLSFRKQAARRECVLDGQSRGVPKGRAAGFAGRPRKSDTSPLSLR
jgi:hypothetical protein